MVFHGYGPLNKHCALVPTYGVLVVEIDDEAEWPSGESLVGGEGVVEGGLAFGLHDAIVHSSREILDVEGKVLGITEGSVERLDQELFASCGQKGER